MATQRTIIEAKKWTLISSTSIDFQVVSQSDLNIIESATEPANLDNTKIAIPRKMYRFTKIDGDFWAYSESGAAIAFDPTILGGRYGISRIANIT